LIENDEFVKSVKMAAHGGAGDSHGPAAADGDRTKPGKGFTIKINVPNQSENDLILKNNSRIKG
jgi:hypothetical protein